VRFELSSSVETTRSQQSSPSVSSRAEPSSLLKSPKPKPNHQPRSNPEEIVTTFIDAEAIASLPRCATHRLSLSSLRLRLITGVLAACDQIENGGDSEQSGQTAHHLEEDAQELAERLRDASRGWPSGVNDYPDPL
jgi:hypothetical protein